MGYLLSLQPTFTQGLVLGQLSVFLLLALVLKYLFLVSQPTPTHHLPTTLPARSPSKHDHTRFEDGAESSEWLNLIFQEILQKYRSELRDNHNDSEGGESARSKIERQLNRLRPGSFVDPIVVHSVDLGSSAPRLSNARIHAVERSPASRQIEFDMTYTDTASISLSTSVLFNYPLPSFARLPVSITLSLSLFSSKVLLILPPPASPTPTLTIKLPPQFTLDLHINSLLGSRAKLADVPKLHEMIESQIKQTLADRASWTVDLPRLIISHNGVDVHMDGEQDVKLHDGFSRLPQDDHMPGMSV